MANSHISKIQTGLKGLGYAPGAIDGLFGPNTRKAAQAWLDFDGQSVDVPVQTVLSTDQILQGTARHVVREIVVHCSATRESWMETKSLAVQFAEIRHWHVDDNGWRDIGYHWLIGRAGDCVAGRDETEIGAGVQGHNSGVIHICLIGGHGSSEHDAFSDHFTAAQDKTLRETIACISRRTPIRKVSGHNDYAAKACPGFQVGDWLKGGAA